MPSIDQSTCAGWNEQEVDMYNKYPFFLAKMEVENRPKWETFGSLCKPRQWKPNMGNVMRGVRTNKSPNLRQFAFPNPLTGQPKADYNNVTETANDSILYWQDFYSPNLNFLPSFTDFIDHVSDTGEDMQEKVTRFEDIFYRGMMFHMSPGIFIAQGNSMKYVETTPFDGLTLFDPATMGKSTALLAGLIAAYGPTMSNLTLPSLANGLTKMSVNLGVAPFKGTALPSGDGKALNQQYLIVTHEEAFTQFTFDPYLQANKNCSLDVINASFQGSFFGRAVGRLESLPLFMKADGTFTQPEIRVGNNVALNLGETVPNPDYADVTESPYAISWICGNVGYEKIAAGPPPSAFTGNKMPRNFPGMQWNGEVYLTKDFLIECLDADTGEVRTQTNSKGRFIRYESTLTLGINAKQRRSVFPVLHKRLQGLG